MTESNFDISARTWSHVEAVEVDAAGRGQLLPLHRRLGGLTHAHRWEHIETSTKQEHFYRLQWGRHGGTVLPGRRQRIESQNSIVFLFLDVSMRINRAIDPENYALTQRE